MSKLARIPAFALKRHDFVLKWQCSRSTSHFRRAEHIAAVSHCASCCSVIKNYVFLHSIGHVNNRLLRMTVEYMEEVAEMKRSALV